MNKKMLCGKRFECKFFEDLDDWATKKHKQYQIFTPLVDDSGIDFVIRTADGKYKEIQVKARAEKRFFTITNDFKGRDNYWFVFYCKGKGGEYKLCIIPSKKVKKMLTKDKHITIPADMPNYNFADIFKR